MIRTLIFLALTACQVDPLAANPGQQAPPPAPLPPPTGTMAIQGDTQASLGDTVTWNITGGPPQQRVFVIASASTSNNQACPPQLAPQCLDLREPVRVLGNATFDAQGRARFTFTLPNADALVGRTLRVQAATNGLSGPMVSNLASLDVAEPGTYPDSDSPTDTLYPDSDTLTVDTFDTLYPDSDTLTVDTFDTLYPDSDTLTVDTFDTLSPDTDTVPPDPDPPVVDTFDTLSPDTDSPTVDTFDTPPTDTDPPTVDTFDTLPPDPDPPVVDTFDTLPTDTSSPTVDTFDTLPPDPDPPTVDTFDTDPPQPPTETGTTDTDPPQPPTETGTTDTDPPQPPTETGTTDTDDTTPPDTEPPVETDTDTDTTGDTSPPVTPPPPPPPPTYAERCEAAGVPLPPIWNAANWSPVGWVNPVIGNGGPAGTGLWKANNTPGGTCVALPRYTNGGQTINLFGVICSNTAGDTCFWDNEGDNVAPGYDIVNDSTGGDAVAEDCVDCHRGDNPWVVTPGTVLDTLPATTGYNPIGKPGWNNNLTPGGPQDCSDGCHSIPNLTPEWCGVARGMVNAQRMPPPGEGTINDYQAEWNAILAACQAL